jgi:hypothetical protein
LHFFHRFLSLFRPRPAPPPAWADFLTAPQYQRFLAMVQGYFRGQKVKCVLKDGQVNLAADGRYREQQLGLLNLAQMCRGQPEDQWPRIIAGHFGILQRSWREGEALEKRLGDFAKVAELLAVRLWPKSYCAGDLGNHMVWREDIPGTVSVLVYDLPSTIRNVNPAEVAAWGKEPDELFDLALANVREICIPDVLHKEMGDGLTFTALVDESFYVASHALLLEQYHADLIGAHGTLVGVPHRHVMLAYPIEQRPMKVVVGAVNRLIPVIAGMEKEGPGSISPLLYWYREGRFLPLPYEFKGKTINFYPPPPFLELLSDLGGGSVPEEDDFEG